MEMANAQLSLVKEWINGQLAGTEPWQVVAGTTAATLVVSYIYAQLTHKVKKQRINQLPISLVYFRPFFVRSPSQGE